MSRRFAFSAANPPPSSATMKEEEKITSLRISLPDAPTHSWTKAASQKASTAEIKLGDPFTGDTLKTLPMEPNPSTSLLFSPHGAIGKLNLKEKVIDFYFLHLLPHSNIQALLLSSFQTSKPNVYYILPPLIHYVAQYLDQTEVTWKWGMSLKNTLFAPPSITAVRPLIIPPCIRPQIKNLTRSLNAIGTSRQVSDQNKKEAQRVTDALARLIALFTHANYSEMGLLTIIKTIEQEYADLHLTPQYTASKPPQEIIPEAQSAYAAELRQILKTLFQDVTFQADEQAIRARFGGAR